MQTPKHIIPEWYFLWLYAILKFIPNKVVGILTLVVLLISFLMYPLYAFNNFKYNHILVIILLFLVLFDVGFFPITISLYGVIIYLSWVFMTLKYTFR